MTGEPLADKWERGDAYEQYVGRWSRRVAPLFLSWLRIPAGRRWLDVGCGTGALSATILDQCSPKSITGVEPSEGFLGKAAELLGGRASLHRGSAAEIPLEKGEVDVAVSGLVLNFVPDRNAGMKEMTRVTARGGTIAAYVWDYAEKMEFMRYFWDAAVELDPGAAKMDEGKRFPFCRPEGLSALFKESGLHGVEVTALDVPTPFANFDDFWNPFLGGQGSAPTYAMSLDENARARLRDRARERIPQMADGSIALIARAWAVRGTVAD